MEISSRKTAVQTEKDNYISSVVPRKRDYVDIRLGAKTDGMGLKYHIQNCKKYVTNDSR